MGKCNHCKSEVGPNDVFCTHCGNKVDGSKETEEIVKKKSGYVVLGEDSKDSIALKEEKFSFKKLISKFKARIGKKPEHYGVQSGSESINEISEDFITTTSDKAEKQGKFFINRESDEESSENDSKKSSVGKDEFILEGYEGVYYSTSRLSKAKLIKYASYLLSGFVALILLFLIFNTVDSILFPPVDGSCPFECCTDGVYEDKLCPGYSTCQANKCVLEACPSDYECCSGVLYQEKACLNNDLVCSSDFECVKKECPYECCSEKEDFAPKACENGENCINNKCYLEPCPYECCEDETSYNDKLCSVNEVCSNNKCELGIVHDTKKVASFLKTVIDIVI